MRTLFNSGIICPRGAAWMGWSQSDYQEADTTANTTTKETNWWEIATQGLESGVDAYGSYTGTQTADAQADAKRAEADAAASAARTALITQDTMRMQQEALANQNKIMGIDKTAFFVGASLLGLGVLGGIFYVIGKK
jgi:hypothetical protein